MSGAGVRFGVIVNPTAGHRAGTIHGERTVAHLTARGYHVVDLSAASHEVAHAQARDAIARGAIDTLVVVGGDGMVNLGVNLVAETDLPLGIVAAGTGNDAARELDLPVLDAARAVERMVRGRTRLVDAVRGVDSAGEPQWFLGVLAAGFDARVSQRAGGWERLGGRLRYTLAAACEIFSFRPIDYSLVIDGVPREVKATIVAVANGPAYGAGMRIAPEARFDDGQLDVVIVHEVPITTLLRVFPRVFAGSHATHPAVESVCASRVRITARGVTAYADGERFATLPIECEVVPAAVRILT